MFTRRAISSMALAAAAGSLSTGALAAAAKPVMRSQGRGATTVAGVRLGTCQYNYRDIPRVQDTMDYMDLIALAAQQAGGGLMEFHMTYIEPMNDLPQQGVPRPQDIQPAGPWTNLPAADVRRQREELRRWRMATPMSFFTAIRRKFENRGIQPFGLGFVFTPDMTDAEIEYGLNAAQALGASVINTNSTKVEMAPRLAPFVAKRNIRLGWHNHANFQDPNEVSSWESFEKVFAASPLYYANLDLGWMAGSNLDGIAFLKKNHARITHVHMKDRKRNKGPGTPWGEGDAPLKEALQLIKQNRWPIAALVEYEYPGKMASIDETRKCMDLMRSWLA